MKTSTILQLISALLILLFIYTAMSKLLAFEQFKGELYAQTLPRPVAAVLIWSLPEIEIITAVLLFKQRTRLTGLCVSAILMVLFTGYVALVLLDVFGRVPCTCGGVIKAFSWPAHLLFNIFFLLLTTLGIIIMNRERRTAGKIN
jgi:putative oxidoreductase